MSQVTVHILRDIEHNNVVQLMFLPETYDWEDARVARESDPIVDTAKNSKEWVDQTAQFIKEQVPVLLKSMPTDTILVLPEMYLESLTKRGITAEELSCKTAESLGIQNSFHGYSFSGWSMSALVRKTVDLPAVDLTTVVQTAGKISAVTTGKKVRKSDVCRGLIVQNLALAEADRKDEAAMIALIAETCGLTLSIAKGYYKNNLAKAKG
jgi:hypothetical protein